MQQRGVAAERAAFGIEQFTGASAVRVDGRARHRAPIAAPDRDCSGADRTSGRYRAHLRAHHRGAFLRGPEHVRAGRPGCRSRPGGGRCPRGPCAGDPGPGPGEVPQCRRLRLPGRSRRRGPMGPGRNDLPPEDPHRRRRYLDRHDAQPGGCGLPRHPGLRRDRHEPGRCRRNRRHLQRRLRRELRYAAGRHRPGVVTDERRGIDPVGINGATSALAVENEEMDDSAVTGALAAAARRGVDVTVTMTADSEWDQAFAELTQAGVHIRLYPDDSAALYIHAKAVVADAGLSGQQVLVGSQNFSVSSLDYNRELGIITHDPTEVAAVSRVLGGDYAGAASYSPAAAATQSASAKGADASCTATASVYNAHDDENNVYVHSNQPDQNATASAGSYSHSYRTDGSGYALIYLNGPPPGVQITVTVGGATCTTSD